MTQTSIYGLVIFLMTLSVVGCGPAEPPTPPLRPVKAMRIQDKEGLSGRWLPGRASATREINLAFRISGPLIEMPLMVGDQVKQGDVVARIDPRDFRVALQAAESNVAAAQAQLQAMQTGAREEEIAQLQAAVEQAEARQRTAVSDLARAESLAESRAISQAELDQALEASIRADADLRRAREDLRIGEVGARPEDIAAKQAEIRSLEAAASSARNQLNDNELTAPFDGVVVARFVENFEQVRAQQSILRVLDASQIEMVINVPENLISLAPFVADIECVFDAFPNLQIPARISEIGTEASQTTRTFPVTLLMEQPENGRILPGMAGRARGSVAFPDESEVRIEIPEAAIFEREGRTYVWILDSPDDSQGTASSREVSIKGLSPRGLRIVEGLEKGELIATAGASFLAEGQNVRLLFDVIGDLTP